MYCDRTSCSILSNGSIGTLAHPLTIGSFRQNGQTDGFFNRQGALRRFQLAVRLNELLGKPTTGKLGAVCPTDKQRGRRCWDYEDEDSQGQTLMESLGLDNMRHRKYCPSSCSPTVLELIGKLTVDRRLGGEVSMLQVMSDILAPAHVYPSTAAMWRNRGMSSLVLPAPLAIPPGCPSSSLFPATVPSLSKQNITSVLYTHGHVLTITTGNTPTLQSPPRPNMASNEIPAEAPPPYSAAPGGSSTSNNHLTVPGNDRNGISAAHRRSMEDETRPLPEGWVRTFDPESEHQFFVDTSKDPPRSIWTHPYDDDEYLRTLSSEERERIQEDSVSGRTHPSHEDIIHDYTDEEEGQRDAELPPRPQKQQEQNEPGGAKGFGRKLKDKLTGTTHEERKIQRAKREEQEREAYRRHMEIRKAMARAMQTGQPQLIGRDRQGQDVYIQPPHYGGGGMYGGARMYNPYGGGMYAPPHARYGRPMGMYGRPYGGGYGRGMGMPLGMGLGGGLLGGMMLGGAMGGMGGGDCGGGDGGGGE